MFWESPFEARCDLLRETALSSPIQFELVQEFSDLDEMASDDLDYPRCARDNFLALDCF